MKLVSLSIHGFKRFASKEKVTLDGKIISIIGPNEAGKSSILSLLCHFNNKEQFKTSGPTQEISRGKEYPRGHEVATLTYLIEKSDY